MSNRPKVFCPHCRQVEEVANCIEKMLDTTPNSIERKKAKAELVKALLICQDNTVNPVQEKNRFDGAVFLDSSVLQQLIKDSAARYAELNERLNRQGEARRK